MSRSGYTDECDDNWALIRWRGAVKSAVRGKKGQAFLRELITSLDEIPDRCLIVEELKHGDSVCALGSIGLKRGMDMEKIDTEDRESVAEAFNIPLTLACEIMYENDEGGWRETPQQRWERMRLWATRQLAEGNEA